MSTIARIFARDLKRIVTSPVALVVALGVCVIPSIYAWFNILANWDPYQNTGTVPIAVVVEDEGADVPGMGSVNAGDMVRERLEDNHQLGWTFVDNEETALDGVRSGRYYAAFVIPPDFTSALAGVLDGHAEQARVAYYVNEKANAVAPKVTDTGATTLETQISSEFVSVAGEAVTQRLKGAVSSAAKDVDGTRTGAVDELRATQDRLERLANVLDGSLDTIDLARGAVADARETLSAAAGAATSFQSSLDGTLGSLGDAREGVRAFARDLDQRLGTGVSTVSGISSLASQDIGRLAGDVGWAQGKLDAAISQIRAANGTVRTFTVSLEAARKTIVSLTPANEEQKEIQAQLTAELDAQIALLVQLSDAQLAQLDELQAAADGIAAGADSVSGLASSVNDAVQTGADALSGLRAELSTGAGPELSAALDALADAGGRLAGGADALGPVIEQADGSLAQLDALMAQCRETLGDTAGSLRDSAGRVGSLADDLAAVQSAKALPVVADVLSLDPAATGDALGSPVRMVDEAVFPVANYGSGVAPFYTNLALWVGGFVLVAIYKLEVDREGLGVAGEKGPGIAAGPGDAAGTGVAGEKDPGAVAVTAPGVDPTPTQAFFGRWLLLALLGQVQALICCVGDVALGVQCVSAPAFVLAGMAASAVYVLVVYSLAVALKHVGKALAVLLVVLQIPGASGLYPIQMQPEFFRALGPWLPFTYGINAMREAVAGFYGANYAHDLLALCLFVLPALLLGVVARRRLLGVNALFDQKMAQTDLLVTERDGQADAGRLTLLVDALSASPAHREEFLARAARFELAYPRRARRGVLALLCVPLALLALLFVHPAKLALLTLWVVSLVAASGYLIWLEYVHERLRERAGLARMSRDELLDLVQTGQKGGDAR